MNKSGEHILSVMNLSVGYGRHNPTVVLEAVRADIDRGDIVVMVGPNGAGKSTLLRTITGMQPRLAGTIAINGQDIKQLSIRQMSRRVALVYTEGHVATGLRVEQMVAMGRQPHTGLLGRLNDEDNCLVAQAMERVGISHLAQRRMGEISDGERQKAMIARAIAQDTPLIVLDEPTSFLDVAARIEIAQLMSSLAREHQKAVVMSSHDVASALSVATHVWAVNPGRHAAELFRVDDAGNALNALFENRGIVFDATRQEFVSKEI